MPVPGDDDTLVSKYHSSVHMSQQGLPPATQEAVVDALIGIHDRLPTQLRIAARYVIDHPVEVGVQTMRTLAARAGIHPNSFIRLARQLGFDGFESMRERFRDFVRSGAGSSESRALWLQQMAGQGGMSSVVARMATSTMANLEQMVQSQDIERLENAVSRMLGSRRVLVLGVGAGYAPAYNFWYVARMICDHFFLVPHHGSLPMDDIVTASASDTLFCMTFQPYRRDILQAMQYARQRGTYVIGLSDSPAARVCREADLGLHVPTHTPQFFHSNTAVFSLLETLCALLAASGGDDAVSRVERFSRLRWESGTYEE